LVTFFVAVGHAWRREKASVRLVHASYELHGPQILSEIQR